jgi:16S rRNA (uracil1498-N3)-methyltransferase
LKQFILKNMPDKDNIVRLEGNDYRYLVRVRRLAVGELFPALLPDGAEKFVQITSINNNVLTGICTSFPNNENLQENAESIPPIILFQALPKGDKMDLIVRQAAEGGVSEVVPFVSEFSVAKTAGQKFIRWERIIKEARQQSGSKTATALHRLLTIDELFDYWQKLKKMPHTLGLLFHHTASPENSCAGGLEQNSLHGYLYNNPETLSSSPVILTIGPEGGFSQKEAAFFIDKGFLPFTIGDTVLRTETAALYFTAAVRILLLERNSWELKHQSQLRRS